MGRQKASANNEAEVAHLTLAELNKLIAHAEWRYNEADLNSALRRGAFSRLTWLEAQREEKHGIAAPSRRPHRRAK